MNSSQRGFTIIELLIATAVFSMILVMITAMMINIGALYYKGVNQSKVQANVRNLSDELSQQLQLSNSGYAIANANSYCVGTNRYTFVLEKQIGPADAQHSPHVLWRDKVASGSCPAPNASFLSNPSLYGSVDGSELIEAKSRLTDFRITGSSATGFTVNIAIAYGDRDFLVGTGLNTKCVSGANKQFCAVSKLQTVVAQRISP